MDQYEKISEQGGEALLLTEPALSPREDTVKRYELARERYRAYHKALELILEPGLLTLVDQTVKARQDMDACMVEYMGGAKREATAE